MSFLIVILLAFFSAKSFAQSAIPSAYGKAVENELMALQSQKAGLESQANKAKLQHEARLKSLENEFLKLQKELLQSEKQNAERQRELSRIKEMNITSLEKEQKVKESWARLQRLLQEKESLHALHLEAPKSGVTIDSSNEGDGTASPNILLKQFMILAEKSFASEQIAASYLQQTDLVETPVLRHGLMGAATLQGGPIYPDNEGRPHLAYEPQALAEKGFYLFDSYKPVKAHAQANLFERMAFALPGLFIAALFVLVFGLFALFVRE